MFKYKRSFKYKYTLLEDYTIDIDICPPREINHKYFTLTILGHLTIKKGYSWNGATGDIDTDTIIRGSCVHDCLYQMLRERLLRKGLRKRVDQVFIAICKEDGMCWLRQQWVYAGVRSFGGFFIKPKDD